MQNLRTIGSVRWIQGRKRILQLFLNTFLQCHTTVWQRLAC
jgi:hypothetical protein